MTKNGFEEKSLADIATKEKYAIVDGPFGSQLHASEYTAEGIPVVRVVNTSYAGRFNGESLVYISEKKAQRLLRSKVVPGDIILAKTGATIGKSSIFPNNFSYGIIASSCIKLTVDPSKYDNRFVCYLLQSYEGQRKIIDGAGGSTRTTINTKPFGAIRLFFPNKREQVKIADVLSRVDQALDQTEELIAKQQRIKTGLMQDLLTRGIDEQGNLRSERTHKFKASPLGRIPVEWEVKPATKLCVAVLDCKNRTPPVTNEGHPVIRTPNVRGGQFVYRDLAYTDPVSYDIWVARGKPRPGDVVITREAPFGEACLIPDNLFEPCLGQRMMMYQTDSSKLRSDYLVFAIYSHAVQKRLLELAGGSTVGHIRVDDIRTLPIPHPLDTKEQKLIAQFLTGAATSIRELEKQAIKLRSLKTALMQDLLSGNMRVTTLLNDMEAVNA